MYRRPYAVYLNAIAALIASLLFFGAIASGTFKQVANAATDRGQTTVPVAQTR